MRMEVNGRCLECDCQEFAPAREPPKTDEEVMARIRAALERVEHLQSMLPSNGSPKSRG